MGALDLNGFDLLGLDLDVLALGDLVAAALIVFVDDLAADFIHHLLAQAMAGFAVDLVEVGFLGLARGRVILVGFIAGIIARNLLPGPNNPSGFILTTVLGVAGAFVATYLGQHMGWYRLDQGAGFIGATLGAVIVLFVWHRLVVTHTVTDPTTRDPLGPRRWL